MQQSWLKFKKLSFLVEGSNEIMKTSRVASHRTKFFRIAMGKYKQNSQSTFHEETPELSSLYACPPTIVLIQLWKTLRSRYSYLFKCRMKQPEHSFCDFFNGIGNKKFYKSLLVQGHCSSGRSKVGINLTTWVTQLYRKFDFAYFFSWTFCRNN